MRLWCPCRFGAALLVVSFNALTAIAIALVAAAASLQGRLAGEEASDCSCFAVAGSRKWGHARIRPQHHSRQLACQFTSLITV